jgi:hypothetical protein
MRIIKVTNKAKLSLLHFFTSSRETKLTMRCEAEQIECVE